VYEDGRTLVMSLHKLSAGGGVDYLLRHTCRGDVGRVGPMPLSSYYVETGYPPGRWMGDGLAGVGDGHGIAGAVDEKAMTRLFGLGLDPVTGAALGANWRVCKTLDQRITERVYHLPTDIGAAERAGIVERIHTEEAGRSTPIAVSGFDLTFTLPKSASVLWALADPATQTRIASAHAAAVNDCLALLEQHALFTRVGKNGVAQVATRGALAVGFDHWDTRTGDPNLHTHLVIANKIQGLDGVWRTIDAKGLYAATVAISETYDVLVADKIAATTGATWSVRDRHERSALFEIDGVQPELLAEFSQRSVQVTATLRGLLADFHTRNNRTPNRAEMLRIRQHATRLSRPTKQLRPLPELLARWRDRATRLLPTPIDAWVAQMTSPHLVTLRAGQLSPEHLEQLAKASVDAVAERRSTWTRWNLLAEAARATKTLRMVSTSDRLELLEHVAQVAIDAFCLPLDPPELTLTPARFLRPDGTSAFRRHRADIFTSPAILAAEDLLLAASRDLTAGRASSLTGRPLVAVDQGTTIELAADQTAAVASIATSGRRVDVLVGPAGSGKTTTMRALKEVWEIDHGPGSVVGLAPSATAAGELAASLGVECENTTKWIYETTGPRAAQREHNLSQLRANRAIAVAAGHSERVAEIDYRGNPITAADRRFQLEPNQLLIVDEASLAGTLALAEITRQAAQAGAKVLLVGDHRQLSSVDAGGAFGLLATETGAVELTSLWRFRHPWEAVATQQLRIGDTAAIDSYTAHDRLHEGPAEVMTTDAYQAWLHAVRGGQKALLIAADNATVATLNDQARADRVIAGDVEPGGVQLHDGTSAGVGDIVVTRTNNRRVRTTARGWVRNGDLWTVTHRADDGSLTVRRNRDAADPRTCESTITLEPGYVASSVELGYAITAHRAQGMTVDTAFALLRAGMAREVAYVALTRGRDANHAFIATDLPDPDYDGAPTPAPTGRHIMGQILATQGAELSATQTLRQLYDHAESLEVLGAVHETLVRAAMKSRYQQIITAALPADAAEAVLSSPAYGALVTAMRRAEHDGLDVSAAFHSIAAGDSLAIGTDPTHTVWGDGAVRDPAALLQWRLDHWHAQTTQSQDHRPLLAGLVTPARPNLTDMHADERGAIVDVETRMAARASAVANQLIEHPPAWLHAGGPQPVDPETRARWEAASAAMATLRDAGATDTAYRHGDLTPTEVTERAARQRALEACEEMLAPSRQLGHTAESRRSDRSPSR
jgi:conjugative relaxase-like TrwC/TraI family protein